MPLQWFRLVLLSLLLIPGALIAQDFNALAKQGRPQLARVQTEPDRGNTHVPSGTAVAASEPLPLSGPHWPKVTPSGFYQEPQPKGELIHALEHGQVVVQKGLGDDVVLTAWRRRLRLDTFDESALAAFMDAYMGRGPENPAR